MIVECGVSVLKLPLVLMLGSMYHTGHPNIDDIVSASTADRLLQKTCMYDAALLREDFEDVHIIHIQADISGRQGEERLSLWGTGYCHRTHQIVRKLLWQGALPSKTGEHLQCGSPPS